MKARITNFIFLTPALLFVLFLISCGSSKPVISSEDEAAVKAETDKKVELLDLKSNIIILQSEIIELKSEIIRLKSQNVELQNKLDQKVEQLKSLEEKLGVEKGREGAVAFGKGEVESERVPEAVSGEAPRKPYGRRYNDALNLHFDRNYKGAIDEFRKLIDEDPVNPLADNCQYWIAESYYSLEDYSRAIEEFKKVFNFKDSNKMDHAQFKIALSYLKMGDRERAGKEFKKFLETFPDSDLVDRVKDFLRE